MHHEPHDAPPHDEPRVEAEGRKVGGRGQRPCDKCVQEQRQLDARLAELLHVMLRLLLILVRP